MAGKREIKHATYRTGVDWGTRSAAATADLDKAFKAVGEKILNALEREMMQPHDPNVIDVYATPVEDEPRLLPPGKE